MRVILVVFVLFLLPAAGIFTPTPLETWGFTVSNVIFNEIAWMGTLPKEGESTQAAANNEWLELYNPTPQAVLLDGWKIISQDGAPDIILSGTIPSSGYFLLERANDDVVSGITADLIYPYKNNALSNDGEHLFLRDATGAVIDGVDASSGWPAGDNSTKDTMQRVGNQWVSASSTPRAINKGAVVPPSSPSSQSGSSTQQSAVPLPPPVMIKSYAGEDKTAVSGSLVEFTGSSRGINDESLDNARFWWNFGDGASQEGRLVSHIFQIPGKYIVGLHVSSGIYAASDYLAVEVVPNKIYISGVVGGEEGYIKLRNLESAVLDIGEWLIKDSEGRTFVVPSKTKIGDNAEIAFSNKITGLFREEAQEATIFYPNLTPALHWSLPAVQKEVTPSPQEVLHQAKLGAKEKDKTAVAPTVETAAVSSSSPRPFFAAAFLLSLIAALGFLLAKKFFLT